MMLFLHVEIKNYNYSIFILKNFQKKKQYNDINYFSDCLINKLAKKFFLYQDNNELF